MYSLTLIWLTKSQLQERGKLSRMLSEDLFGIFIKVIIKKNYTPLHTISVSSNW